MKHNFWQLFWTAVIFAFLILRTSVNQADGATEAEASIVAPAHIGLGQWATIEIRYSGCPLDTESFSLIELGVREYVLVVDITTTYPCPTPGDQAYSFEYLADLRGLYYMELWHQDTFLAEGNDMRVWPFRLHLPYVGRK